MVKTLLYQKTSILKKLSQLDDIVNSPKLFIANYFQDLRTRIDLFFCKELFNNKTEITAEIIKDLNKTLIYNDQLTSEELNKIWIEFIALINDFEIKLQKNKYDLSSYKESFKEIRIRTDEEYDFRDLKILKYRIYYEESMINRILFEHTNIMFYIERGIPILKFKNTSDNDTKKLKLDLDPNDDMSIFRLKENTFSGFSNFNLVRLELTHNNIKEIKSGVFNYLPNLNHLLLIDCNIESIEVGSFKNLTNLLNLFMYSNLLTKIEDGIFLGLEKLEILDLSSNKIFDLDFRAFLSCTNLKYLSLQRNKLTTIKKFYNNNLKVLNLSTNNIYFIEDFSFSHLTKLTELNLHCNSITDIHPDTLHGLINLRELILDGNPFVGVDDLVPIIVSSLNLIGTCPKDYSGSYITGQFPFLTRISIKNSDSIRYFHYFYRHYGPYYCFLSLPFSSGF